VKFQTKIDLALGMIERAALAKHPWRYRPRRRGLRRAAMRRLVDELAALAGDLWYERKLENFVVAMENADADNK
jgi:hypothetical protein